MLDATTAPARAALLEHLRRTSALGRAAQLLGWDRQTQMPPAGAAQRAASSAALAAAIHARHVDPGLPGLVDAAEAELLAAGGAEADPATAVDIAKTRRSLTRAARTPERLVGALAHATAAGEQTWAAARRASDFAAFLPVLEEVVALKREEAAALADPGQDPYDALLDDFEPGMTAAEIEPLFARLRDGLRAIRSDADMTPGPEIPGPWPVEASLAAAREAATAFGYDWTAGRIDLTTHPFCSGAGRDVRITTRTTSTQPLDTLLSTIHETGHAVYEQRIAPELFDRPSGDAASMGVHESQSRLFENQIGRSRAFAEWLHPLLRARLGDMAPPSAEALHRSAARVHPGFIRTEADEVHYNLHIILRFELERELIAGRLAPKDLPEAWNARFAEDFGAPPPDDARGVLQDVHWSAGLFGYFPTYTLGNLWSAALWSRMRAEVRDMEAAVARGEIHLAVDWLTEHVHRHGSLLEPKALMARAIGAETDERPLLAYLRDRHAG